jgi:HSP20 family protein
MAATGTRAPLGMPMDVYRAGDGSYHVEADLTVWTRTASM